MPSNANLMNSIAAISAEAVTEGLTNAQLATMLKDLQADSAPAVKGDATARALAKKQARTQGTTKPKPKPPYYVAPRKAITSMKGILSGDTEDEVKASFLAGGETALTDFVKSGHILKG